MLSVLFPFSTLSFFSDPPPGPPRKIGVRPASEQGILEFFLVLLLVFMIMGSWIVSCYGNDFPGPTVGPVQKSLNLEGPCSGKE